MWESQTRPSAPKQSSPRSGRLIWERPSPARPASLPFFARTVCLAPEALSQKCSWDLGLHKGGVSRGPLPAGSADSRPRSHAAPVPINFSQRSPGLLQEPALLWNRKLYLHCLGARCSSIKGKRLL